MLCKNAYNLFAPMSADSPDRLFAFNYIYILKSNYLSYLR